MDTYAYRLWQTWQQMHYPRTGLPDADGARGQLVALDGFAGMILERQFCRRPRPPTLDTETCAELHQCQRELDHIAPALSDDASRYFSRLNVLIGFVLSSEDVAVFDDSRRPATGRDVSGP